MILIDREALCQDLLDRWNVADEKEESEIQNVMADVVTPIVSSQPTIEMPSWIPVTERLPEEREVVLITNDKGNVRYGQFRGTRGKYWYWKGNTLEEVIAWMELPEPYREDGES